MLATVFGVNPLFLIAGITNDVSEIVDMVAKMELWPSVNSGS